MCDSFPKIIKNIFLLCKYFAAISAASSVYSDMFIYDDCQQKSRKKQKNLKEPYSVCPFT